MQMIAVVTQHNKQIKHRNKNCFRGNGNQTDVKRGSMRPMENDATSGAPYLCVIVICICKC